MVKKNIPKKLYRIIINQNVQRLEEVIEEIKNIEIEKKPIPPLVEGG